MKQFAKKFKHFLCNELTDDADKVSALAVLQDPVVAVSISDEEEVRGVGNGHGRRGAEVGLVVARNKSLAENEIGFGAVYRNLERHLK